jgi:4-alpha-glucanotransferase
VWRRRKLFALEASGGAPPDDFFTKGQDWGFPPPHPERWREEGHAYFRECLSNQLRYAGTLRIDHVMGLHRFFWVPKGAIPMDGTYVRYPAEELYAVLCLESNRNRARIVGEDLGTVPPYVRPAMGRHRIRRIYVAQFGASPDPDRPMGTIPKSSVACMNTHDMPTFASFWNGLDVEQRVSLGFLDRKAASREKSGRAETARALWRFLRRLGKLPGRGGLPGEAEALRAALAYLAASPAETVIVSLEDLWRERTPHNVPGTWKECPNWRRKSRHSFEEFRELPEVVGALAELNRIRKAGGRR